MRVMHFNLTDGEVIEFTREEVASSTNVKRLKGWWEVINYTAIELSIHLRAQAEGGVADPALGKKLGFFRVGEHLLRTRLAELDVEVGSGSSRERRQAAEINRLLDRVKHLTTLVESYEAQINSSMTQQAA